MLSDSVGQNVSHSNYKRIRLFQMIKDDKLINFVVLVKFRLNCLVTEIRLLRNAIVA